MRTSQDWLDTYDAAPAPVAASSVLDIPHKQERLLMNQRDFDSIKEWMAEECWPLPRCARCEGHKNMGPHDIVCPTCLAAYPNRWRKMLRTLLGTIRRCFR